MAKKAANAIIIKKVKKADHGSHHGGAWKVAYADFVTAMMAFFLLLWLLNVTTDVQKRGIADYFDPTVASNSASGAGGILGGQTIGSPGSEVVALARPSFQVSLSAPSQPTDNDDSNSGGANGSDRDQSGTTNATTNTGSTTAKRLTDAEFKKQQAEREQKSFDEAKKALEHAVQQVPDLKALAKNLLIDETPEGLRIQLVDQDKSPMFPRGSAEMLDPAKKLLTLVSQVILKMPNKISITGHTDSTQYALSSTYTNWELSADRANDSRRELVADGVPADRIAQVVGVADQDPLDKANPADPRNRRISIVLLRQNPETSPASNTSVAAASVATAAPALTKTPPLPRVAPPPAATETVAPSGP